MGGMRKIDTQLAKHLAESRNPSSKGVTRSSGEAAHFAHAAASVMRALTAQQITKCGEELLELIEREAPVAALRKVGDSEKPTLKEMRAIAEQLARKRNQITPLDRVLGWVGDIFNLDEIERTVLAVVARWGKFESWRDLVRRAPNGCSNLTPNVIARLADLPSNLVEQKLMPGSLLLSCRLFNDDQDGEYSLSRLLRRLVRVHADSREALLRWLMPNAEASALLWDDFDHLGPVREVAEKVLAAREPVSILLFGEPGTGKTEFARLLASRVGRGALFAGLSDDQGMEPDRSERLDHLMLLRALCRNQPTNVVVVDEADDVLVLSERKGSSKQWINRLVEDPKVKTIWIVNRRTRLDPAVLRRMTLAIGFDRPRLPVRERIVRRAAAATSVSLSSAEMQEIASLKTCPAVVASGLRAAQLSHGGADVAKTAIHSVMRALGQSRAPEIMASATYDPLLSKADTDLALLAERLAGAPDKGWSLLLSGPSGTGKSAFARHLAVRMGIEVEYRRCSDLMSPYVGETEQNIAEAFATAAEREALLLIDEADSFLYRREAGQRSWEVSQVNEMLVQMEHLRAPFVATTNLADKLDPASQRRFTLRVAFQTMTLQQARLLFRAHFGQDWPPQRPVHDGQTPGDFAVVAHRAQLLGEQDPLTVVRWLRDEIEARGNSVGGTMGFRLPEAPAPIKRAGDEELEAA
jgi:transitional endoplasmic reticulum ATPase